MKNFILFFACICWSCGLLAQNIVQLEYAIDNDAGIGQNNLVNVNPSSDGTFSFNADVSSVSPGYHKLYVRTKDENGAWSFTGRRNLEIFVPSSKINIVSGEYFIDSDPGYGNGNSFNITTPDSIILENFSAVASSLPEGYHKLYGRVLDDKGKWGFTFRRNMEVYKNSSTIVRNAEYFFKTDLSFGDCNPVVFSNPSSDGTFSFSIPLNQLPADADTLFVRVQDDINNSWSFTQILNTGLSSPVPLTLLDFSANRVNYIVDLKWQTANEINTAYFSVQRSTDALHFNTIGKVAANNRSGINDYSYADNTGGVMADYIYYRLQQTDIDGRSFFSKIVSVNIEHGQPTLNIYPNPAKNYITIFSASPSELNSAFLTVSDMTGRIVIRQRLKTTERQKVNISLLLKGIYTIRINRPGSAETRKLIVE